MEEIYNLLPNVQVKSRIGSSPLGLVYQVVHPEFGNCCCKILIPEKKNKQQMLEKKKLFVRCLSNLKMMRLVHHENIAKVYSFDEEDGLYVIREFIPGQNLEQLVHKNKSLELETANIFFEKILYALQRLHAYGIVYKNLKPNNIIITPNENLKLVDISVPQTTSHCLSPEQCAGKKAEIASDIYALGIIYYFCIVGKYPYQYPTMKEIMNAHINEEIPDIAKHHTKVSPELAKLVSKMLSKEPQERPESCEEILQVLQNIGILSQSNLGIPLVQAQEEDVDAAIQLEVPNGLNKKLPEANGLPKMEVRDLSEIRKGLDETSTLVSTQSVLATNREISALSLPKIPPEDLISLTSLKPPPLPVIENFTNEKVMEAIPTQYSSTNEEIAAEESIAEDANIDEDDVEELTESLDEENIVYETIEPTIKKEVAVEEFSLEKLHKLKQVVSDMTNRLKIVNQTLSMLEDAQGSQGFEAILFLEEMLRFIISKIGELVNADRTIIFLIDDERNELLPILDKNEGISFLEFRLPPDEGVLGQAIATKKVINISYDCYDDVQGIHLKKLDEKTGYRTYTMLCLPIIDREGIVIAILQLMNKFHPESDPAQPLADRILKSGFGASDEKLFQEFIPSFRVILDASRAFYRATQRVRAMSSLMSSMQTLSQSSLDLNESLHKVMDEARRLIDADRMTLWLLDHEKNELFANIQMADGNFKEIRIPKTAGFAGKVVETNEALMIPFDLYDHPGAQTAKNTDRVTSYRTCSLMCLPVFNLSNQLIGVTQFINKRRQGEFSSYNPSDWPKPPDCWKTSFSKSDLEFIRTFNIQAGVTLQNATMFAKIKQQEQMQRDIMRSLANGVISVDKMGRVIVANESAKRLLGIGKDERIEQRYIKELVHLKDCEFIPLLEMSLGKLDDTGKIICTHDQYYPEQTLQSKNTAEEHNINLSLHSITDVQNPEKICGSLVVMDDISDEKRIKAMMYRYMTKDVVEQLLKSGNMKLGGELKEVSVMFSDIRSYTTLTEGMTAEQVVAMLNEYFELMVEAIFQFNGTLDKYIGDAIMAVFGSPLPLTDHAWCAVQCAIEMRNRLAQFNQKRIQQGFPAIHVGIGVHSDKVVSGNIGSSKRMEFTSIGDGVNLASRLESITKQYGCDLVISEETYNRCMNHIHVRELDFIIVKGKTKAVKIYEVIGLKSIPLSEEQKSVLELYNTGRTYYQKQMFIEALDAFKGILTIRPKDNAAALYAERCRHLIEEPPEEDWDGVWKWTSK